MEKENERRIALFIDAENISYKNAGRIMDVLNEKGRVIVREIVADWSKIKTADDKNKKEGDGEFYSWREVAAAYSMTADQQFSFRRGKNSSDIRLTVRVMETLYEQPYIDVFCIVSNDCDFTDVARSLIKHNKDVIGMGEKEKAVNEFVNAFSEYIYLDDDDAKDVQDKVAELSSKAAPAKPSVGKKRLAGLRAVIRALIDEKGFALFSQIGTDMRNKISADFVPRNFGYKGLRPFLSDLAPFLPEFEIKENEDDFMFIEKRRKKPNNK